MMKEEKYIYELHNYLNVSGLPEDVVEKIVKDIPNSEDIGFAGLLERDLLKKFLRGFILDKEGNNQPYSYDFKNEKEVKRLCEEILKKCEKYIDEKIHIFLFPTYDKFVIERMDGVNGFCPWKNTIWIFINFGEHWEESLKETVVHELAHAVSLFYMGGNFSIGQGLILDGMAEHFKEFIIPGRKSPWTRALSKEKIKIIFDEIKPRLNEKNYDFYNEVFYGTGKYPLWTGYTIGYYLVRKYLKNQKNVDWRKILMKNPNKILKKSLDSLK